MTEFTYDSFAEQFRALVPGFDRVYDEHVGGESVALKQAMRLLEGGMGCEDPQELNHPRKPRDENGTISIT